MTIQQLKRRYLAEGFKLGYKRGRRLTEHALNESMEKGDKIRIMYRYKGEEVESDAIFLGHRDDTYMYADDPHSRGRDEQYLVKVRTPDNKMIIKELDSTMTPKPYPEINYCDDLESIIGRRESDRAYAEYNKPIRVGTISIDGTTLTINGKSFTAEKVNADYHFTDGQLAGIERQLNRLVKGKGMEVVLDYSWRLSSLFRVFRRSKTNEADLYIKGSRLGINEPNAKWARYQDFIEIADVKRSR